MTKDKKDNTTPQPSRNEGARNEGEGNYTAARHYNRDTEAFTRSGQVETAARDAAKARDSAEREELDAAEREGRKHGKGEDPQVARPSGPAPRR